ncbi:hypothetical protein [Natronoglycomyces albus]|uniref:Glycerophosphoryl diester phosphodiesterase membrane domain-containing protein n=1 Tax=Natronoglycomyces albus TaxID=2811108 RepID=A0A895XTM3_9ACTN|nr:hypothetical protein [Natronoglycomyces albus]QSB05600.1 hypothetical protein JQS30_01325 [Natronoglycomyces albus]
MTGQQPPSDPAFNPGQPDPDSPIARGAQPEPEAANLPGPDHHYGFEPDAEDIPPRDNPYWEDDGLWETSDPIVTGDFGSWCQASLGVIQRSWRSMGIVLGLGVVLPGWVFSLIGLPSYFTPGEGFRMAGDVVVTPVGIAGIGQGLTGLVLVYFSAAAFLAATRIAVAEAAGGFLSLPEAIRYGLRRGGMLWLWVIVSFIIVSIGMVLLVLPGLWALFALSLIIAAYAFDQHRNPLGRSIELTHSALGPALGRAVFSWLVAICLTSAIQISVYVLGSMLLATIEGWFSVVVATIILGIMSILMIATYMWIVSAHLCTYAFLRGRKEPLTTTQLAAEAAPAQFDT